MFTRNGKEEIVYRFLTTQQDILISRPFKKFAEIMLGKITEEHLLKEKDEDILRKISFFWELLQEKKAPSLTYKVEIWPIPSRKIKSLMIGIATNDQPYLIESIQVLLQKWNLKTQLFIHPLLSLKRTKKGKSKSFHIEEIEEYHPKNMATGLSKEVIICIQAKWDFEEKEVTQFKEELERVLSHLVLYAQDNVHFTSSLILTKENLEKNKLMTEHEKNFREDIEEAINFLSWLEKAHFLFLGYRYYEVVSHFSSNMSTGVGEKEGTPYGIFKEPSIAGNVSFSPFLTRTFLIPQSTSSKKHQETLIHITKTSQRSLIQRPSRLDLIEVLSWDEQGNLQGIYQFLGIFKKKVFSLSSLDIPLLRQKTVMVLEKFNARPETYEGKALLEVINSIPKDEMFNLTIENIYNICRQVLELKDASHVRLFSRHDPYGEYVTVMIYLTRDRFSQHLKTIFGQVLEKELKGHISSNVAHLGDLPFARIIYVLHFDTPSIRKIDENKLTHILEDLSLDWKDRIERYVERENLEEALKISKRYQESFSTAYQEQFSPQEILEDIARMEKLFPDNPVDILLYNALLEPYVPHLTSPWEKLEERRYRIKIYTLESPLILSDLLPILSNFGFKILSETTYPVQRKQDIIYIHYFEAHLVHTMHEQFDMEKLREGFISVWDHETENDGFNKLVLQGNLSIREVTILRSYVKYLIQAQLPFSFNYAETVLPLYPEICTLLVKLFDEKFNPSKTKAHKYDEVLEQLHMFLNNIKSLEHDRLLRRILNVIEATLRTNYYQYTDYPKTYFSFKLDCKKITNLPLPIPMYEIFVYSTYVEGIHLRGGKVARGGIRWSDRVEDYRTEVLGLMKAQNVKNTVIVPLGSKGGFVVKGLNPNLPREEVMNHAVHCYQTFIRGLLDLTDNFLNKKVVPPFNVVRYDEDDPYLVVAADKGTATFSDIANGISKEYNFWLGDAFASGGSAGYDHKAMGITSRGAWESVKHHFRNLGIDCEATPITTVGVGDMSGDVFGNGMLRTPCIRLVAAFDHRHIFIDPSPDLHTAYMERKRLFEMPRSSWGDYDVSKLSPGGAIFERRVKSVKLPDQAKNLLCLAGDDHKPEEIIQAILKAPVDLLWFGGIGTFIKATHESNSDVGDITNIPVRVDGKTIRAKVIAEGANLGMTQQGRIEYALNGGRLNTDAIDNSAGVDTSDHEVNLKILFADNLKTLTEKKRDILLKKMTDEVAQLVLTNNYRQNQILSLLEHWAPKNPAMFQGLIKYLELDVGLNRRLEDLPEEDAFESRRLKGQGFTRPELAVLLAYSKISLYNQIVSSDFIDLSFYEPYIIRYFPTLLREEYRKSILKHPLRREIVATVLTNYLINRVGPTFIYELVHVSGCSVPEVVHAFFVAVEILQLDSWWEQIDALDTRLYTKRPSLSSEMLGTYGKQQDSPFDIKENLTLGTTSQLETEVAFDRKPPIGCGNLQPKLQSRMASMVRLSVLRLLGTPVPITKDTLEKTIDPLLKGPFLDLINDQAPFLPSEALTCYHAEGIPEYVSKKFSLLSYLNALVDIAILRSDQSILSQYHPQEIANVYFRIRAYFNFNALIDHALLLEPATDWERRTQLGLIDDIGLILMSLTRQVGVTGMVRNVETWLTTQSAYHRHTQEILAHISATSDIGKIASAVRHLQRMPEVRRVLSAV